MGAPECQATSQCREESKRLHNPNHLGVPRETRNNKSYITPAV